MRCRPFLIALSLAFAPVLAAPAYAGQAEAREVARINNCQPKKIEVLQNFMGADGRVMYQVTCNLPKMAGENKDGPDAVLIGCAQAMCDFIRPVKAEQK